MTKRTGSRTEGITLLNHLFMGLTADEWEQADGLPVSPWFGQLTVELVKGGVIVMLRRLDAEQSAQQNAAT